MFHYCSLLSMVCAFIISVTSVFIVFELFIMMPDKELKARSTLVSHGGLCGPFFKFSSSGQIPNVLVKH